MDALIERIEEVSQQAEQGEITPLRGETELAKLQKELDLFTQWAEEGDLSWPRGSELASDEFVAWAQQQRSAQGELLELETVNPTDEEWFRFQRDKTNAEMNTTSPEILVRADLRKIELLEEVLHHIQQRIPNFNKLFPYPMNELHVKDFMVPSNKLPWFSIQRLAALISQSCFSLPSCGVINSGGRAIT